MKKKTKELWYTLKKNKDLPLVLWFICKAIEENERDKHKEIFREKRL